MTNSEEFDNDLLIIEQLKKLLVMSDIECQTHIIKVLSGEDYSIIIGNDEDKISANYIFAYPKTEQVAPVLLMAHWDTVRNKADEPVTLFEENEKIENGVGILGADDRAGISMILEAQRCVEPKPMILFTNYEETGGYGMKRFIESGIFKNFKDCVNLAVSVDRKGHNQWVCYYNNGDKELEEFMLRLGYVEEFGTWTDGAGLASAYNLAHVNVSYGGYLPHTVDEFILKNSYLDGVDRLVSLIVKCDHVFERTVTPSKYDKHKHEHKTITPADNQGRGTAAYDTVPSDTVIMTAEEDPEIEIRLTNPPCELCCRLQCKGKSISV